MLALTSAFERADHLRERKISLALLLLSSLFAVAWSFRDPGQALWFLLLNAASPAISRWADRATRD